MGMIDEAGDDLWCPRSAVHEEYYMMKSLAVANKQWARACNRICSLVVKVGDNSTSSYSDGSC